MSKVAIIIPARYASTRFPGKPLHVIAGKPLIQHVWERCCRAKRADTVIVATDDMRIAEAAFDFGAEVSLTSDKHPTGTDRIAEVAARLRGYSHILNVQGDEPDADPRLLDRLAKTLLDDRRLPMVTACFPFADAVEAASPNNVKVVLRPDGDALYFSRSLIPFDRNALGEAAPKLHLGIYGYSRKFLLQFVKWKQTPLEKTECLEQLRALENGARIRVITARRASLGVDTPEDADKIESLFSP